MESGNVRVTVFLLIAIAAITGVSAFVGSGEPRAASAADDPGATRDRTPAGGDDSDTLVEASASAEGYTLGQTSPRGGDRGALGRSGSRRSDARARAALEPKQRAFLEKSHDLSLPSPRLERLRWSWEDDSTQIIFDGCKPSVRDPRAPKARVSVDAPVDLGRLQAVEDHFGFSPSELLGLRSVAAEIDGASFATQIGEDVAYALAKHGIEVEGGTIRAKFSWLVAQTAPELRALSQAVAEQWRRAVTEAEERGGHASGDAREPGKVGEGSPGNIPRSRDDVEALASFVQRAIPYADVPLNGDEHERCGVRTPGPTLSRGGDCDSKVLLLAAMIRSIDPSVPLLAVSLTVAGRPHMMLGVGVEPHDCSAILDYQRRRYVLIETTSALGVGIMAPDYNDAVLDRFEVVP